MRMSGPDAHAIARRSPAPLARHAAQSRCPRCAIRSTALWIDQAVVIRYDAPHSYTGEDWLKSAATEGCRLRSVLALLIREGARQAEPGEFTRRAVLNGKLDLLQAEGIASVVDARTEAARRGALHQIDGGSRARSACSATRPSSSRRCSRTTSIFPKKTTGRFRRSESIARWIDAKRAGRCDCCEQRATRRNGSRRRGRRPRRTRRMPASHRCSTRCSA